ncbi:MAG TPA: hypothetical protein VIJ40_10095 [Acidimicrobiales bacterium]
MAKSTSGKWVSRVGAAGGGKTYQKQRPSNFYGALFVIVVLGLALVVFSRYEYQNPVKKHSTTVAPAIGKTLYAGISIQACGKTLPFLTASTTSTGGFAVGGSDVVRLAPVSAVDAGANATLLQFAKEYKGLIATTTELAVPNAKGVADAATTFKNGQTCAATSKYAGKTGHVVYAYWTTLGQTKPSLTTNPAKIHFSKNLRITLAFEPKGVTPSAPVSATVNAMFLDTTTPTTTTTLATVPTTTTTLNPTTTTTIASTTTTTKG